MAKKIDVILLEPVRGLGNSGDIVSVANAYAVNKLIPEKKAIKADAKTKNEFIQRKERKKAQIDKRYENLQYVIEKLNNQNKEFYIVKTTNNNGTLYETVDAKVVADELFAKFGRKIELDTIDIEKGIKEIGEYVFSINSQGFKYKFSLFISSA